MSSVRGDKVVPTARINGTDVNLLDHPTESAGDTVGNGHGCVDLAGVGYVKAHLCIRQLIKDTFQFLYRPPHGLAFVHVLQEKKRLQWLPECVVAGSHPGGRSRATPSL